MFIFCSSTTTTKNSNCLRQFLQIYTVKANPVLTLDTIESKVYGYKLSERGLTIITAKNNISN